MKVGIKAARLPCSELENETHLMTFSLLGAAIELDASDLRVIQREPVTVEMLCDGKIRPSLGNASQVFSKTFPKGRFTRYNFVACDKLTTSLKHESFRANQTYNLLTIVAYDTNNVVGF